MQRVTDRDVSRVRAQLGQAMKALMNVDDAAADGRLVRAKQQLGIARGALSGIERLLDEMEFRAERRGGRDWDYIDELTRRGAGDA